jgi:ATP-dependent protease HslVU (ClpYQ) peptidase subunit
LTCIIAIEKDGLVYMGGDSAASSGWDIQVISNPKVFINGNIIFGYTSSFRMGQLLQYSLAIPEDTYIDDMSYLVAGLIPSIRECLRVGGYTKVDNNQESGGFFLVGYHGKIYKVADDFQITHMEDGFLSVGSGSSFALGALAAMSEEEPKQAILKALEIAGHFSNGVRPPYYVFTK